MEALTGVRVAAGSVLLSCGAVAARTDIRDGRICNRHLKPFAALILLLYSVLAAQTILGSRGLLGGRWYAFSFFQASLTHAAACMAAGVGLWLLRVWPSGDAKLFILLAAGIPLMTQEVAGFPYFVFWVLLANIFLPSGLFVVAEAAKVAWSMRWRHCVAALRSMEGLPMRLSYQASISRAWLAERIHSSWKRSGRGFWFLPYFGFGAAMDVLAGGHPELRGLKPYLGYAVFWGLGRWGVHEIPAWISAAAWAAAGVFLAAHPDWLAGALGSLRLWSFIMIFYKGLSASFEYLEAVKRLPQGAYKSAETFPGDVARLKAWWLLSEAEFERVRRRDPDFYERHFEGARYPDGLSGKQARVLKAWCRKNRILTVERQRTMSFAPWIAAGALATVALGQDVAGWLAHRIWTSP